RRAVRHAVPQLGLAGRIRWRGGRRAGRQRRPGVAAGRLVPGRGCPLRAAAMARAGHRRPAAGARAGDGRGNGLPATAPARRRRPAGARRAATMSRRRQLAVLSVLVIAGASMALVPARTAEYPESPQFRDGAFHNPVTPRMPRGSEALGLWWKFLAGKRTNTRPDVAPPLQPLDPAALADAPEHRLYRLGHSTVLVKLDGGWWLTDPVFSGRASPVQWAAPRRFQAPALAREQLPPLRGVILSHDHYDHLDRATVRALADRAELFVTPLGVGERLLRWGVSPDKVRQLDWWQSLQVGGVQLTATPAQHFSGRGLFDRNRTLWASWAIHAPGLNLFFSGDSGYFPGFAEIGERLGPFDLTLLECGAYDELWSGVHMLPEQTVQA